MPRTEAARRELERAGEAAAADLVFLERWESDAPPGIAATLRAAQIRRANRDLCAEIRAELHGTPGTADAAGPRAAAGRARGNG